MALIRRKYLLMLLIAVCLSICNVSGFIPQRDNFINNYQYQLFSSWIQRGDFDPHSPANLSHKLIRISYYDRFNDLSVTVEFDLDKERIVNAREVVPSSVIETVIPNIEVHYRYYLEVLLFRLNSDQCFYSRDFLTDMQIAMTWNNEELSPEVFSSAFIDRERLAWQEIHFEELADGSHRYKVKTAEETSFELIFPNYKSLPDLVNLARKKEEYSVELAKVKKEVLPQPPVSTIAYHYEPEEMKKPSSAYSLIPTLPPARLPDRHMPLREFIETFRNSNWGREMLHNKIADPEHFLAKEFPHHQMKQSLSSYELLTSPFQENISGNVILNKRPLRDGVAFEAAEHYEVHNDKSISLLTGDILFLNELSDSEIDIITPYLAQLIIMHRVIGTRLLDFLLVPADVPTTFVLRDPDRWVSQFSSYTDVILMLSHYWQDRTVYFQLERVKRVNNMIELNGFLAAVNHNEDAFDYAEVKFSLDSSYRIDLAMINLYTNLSKE